MTSTQAASSTSGDSRFWRAPNAGNARTVYGALLNYKGALAALAGQLDQPPYKAPPQAPILYIKPANTHSTDGATVLLPDGVEELRIGAALGVVIGATACRVPAARAFDYVAGYVVVNDVSVPHENLHRPAIRQLCRDGFCPIGPMVACDAVLNPDALSVRVYINDKLEQQNTTANLIRPTAQLIADVTSFLTLSAGDILLVGVPENAPLARAGDQVTIDIEQVGRLQNTIRAQQQRAGGKV
jgi:5-oxopent-3-ene-1,2,5-tricarboxylate decarboxylase/2-hydroxyhepta-2,4-diene-1,7-dioate isomerase